MSIPPSSGDAAGTSSPVLKGAPVDAVVVMGVAGCGKTSVGVELARRLGWPFLEGDSFHPEANIVKMSAGTPLQDDDRWGWLDSIAARIALARQSGERLVVSCSALKRRYRERLSAGGLRVLFVHLHGTHALILGRMTHRTGHFMPTSLLDSQFADLEPLGGDEFGIVCDIDATPADIAAKVAALVG